MANRVVQHIGRAHPVIRWSSVAYGVADIQQSRLFVFHGQRVLEEGVIGGQPLAGEHHRADCDWVGFSTPDVQPAKTKRKVTDSIVKVRERV